jgi:tetratricopeptide (TPR) repeat protein
MHPLVTAVFLLRATLAQVPDAAAAPTEASVVAALEACWLVRDSQDGAKACDKAISEGVPAFPQSYDILWRAARYRWFVADGLTEEKTKRMRAKAGWDYAERAVAVNPKGVQGKYYQAVCIGAYSQAVGILKALSEGLEGKFVDAIDFACKADEAFDRHGCHVVKGRYHWELPWPKRDLGQSKEQLDKILATNPEHLRGWYFLAQTLAKDDKKAQAQAALDKVLKGSIDYDPPEGRRIQAWAKAYVEELK